jgi:hypothetical protein
LKRVFFSTARENIKYWYFLESVFGLGCRFAHSSREAVAMSHIWASDTVFDEVDLFLDGQGCNFCETELDMWGHRRRRVFTLNGPQLLIVRLGHCPAPGCPGHSKSVSSWGEMSIAPPRLAVAWDVFTWIGHRRFSRHWCVPQICAELSDTHGIDLSEDAIEDYIRRYETMVAARHGDLKELRKLYVEKKPLILSIDGLQPEKGHETLYVVRELTQKRVWFAEPLLSSTNDEVRRLLRRARSIAAALDRPVAGWISDKQEAFVQGVAEVFPGTPHGYCKNHFLRDVAKPVLEADSHAKVQMRRKVRGLRSIEQAVLREGVTIAVSEGQPLAETPPRIPAEADAVEDHEAATQEQPAIEPSPAGQVILDYCAAVRGILNDDQGGPLHPPGLRMADALQEVRESLDRCVEMKKRGTRKSRCSG